MHHNNTKADVLSVGTERGTRPLFEVHDDHLSTHDGGCVGSQITLVREFNGIEFVRCDKAPLPPHAAPIDTTERVAIHVHVEQDGLVVTASLRLPDVESREDGFVAGTAPCRETVDEGFETLWALGYARSCVHGEWTAFEGHRVLPERKRLATIRAAACPRRGRSIRFGAVQARLFSDGGVWK